MTSPAYTPRPFDPNNALRDFNSYFGSLRQQYGTDAIRAMGFTPSDLAQLQASLRKLQMDPTATPEQHEQAYRQARDTLAQRLTTPLELTRSYSAVQRPAPAPSASAADPSIVMLPTLDPGGKTPTQEQIYAQARARAQGQNWLWDDVLGNFVDDKGNVVSQPSSAPAPAPTPASMPSIATPAPTPPASNPISNFIATMNAPKPVEPVLPSISKQDYLASMNAPAAAPAAQPSMNTQPGADFDRNIFTRMLNDQFSQLRQKYGDAGLRSAGFTPSTLAGLQGNLRRLSMDPSSTYDQNSAALEAALASMNGYFSPGAGQTGGQQVVPQQPIEVVPQPMPMPQGQPTPGQPVAASAPQPQPTPLAPIPRMYRGGFAVR